MTDSPVPHFANYATTPNMKTIQVYDPPMCCSTGVCGPTIDPILPQFAGFLHQLKSHGVQVERYNLAQQPLAFVQNPAVKAFLNAQGAEKLPLIFIDGELALQGAYPDHDKRVEWSRRCTAEQATGVQA
jgi:Arsenical resistance operon protein ArsD